MRIGTQIRLGSMLALSVVVAGAALSVIVASQSARTVRLVNHTHEVLQCIERVAADLVEAETGARGFVITGQEPFLEPGERGRKAWRADMAELRRLVSDNPRQLELSQQLELAGQRRLDVLEQLLVARRQAGADQAAALVATGRGAAEMARVQGLVAAMTDNERALLNERMSSEQQLARRSVVLIASSTLVLVALIFVATSALIRAITRPIAALVAASEQLGRGQRATLPDARADEIGELARALLAMAQARDETQGRLRALIDQAPDAILLANAENRWIDMNDAARTLLGYEHAELIGKPITELIPADVVAPPALDPATGPAGYETAECMLKRKDGELVPVAMSMRKLADGRWQTFIRDISERKRLDESARLMSDRLASAVETIQDAVALFDVGDRLILHNSAYRRVIGDALDGSLVGRSYQELLDAWVVSLNMPDDGARQRFRALRLSMRGEGTAFDVQTRDGRSLRVIDRRTPEGGTVKTIWDLSDDMRQAQELREAKLAAEAASESKSEFLSSMSHELRTPLNAILGFAQLLRRSKKEPLSDPQTARVAEIIKGGEHLLRLIDDILDLSHIEAGRVSVSVEPVEVHELLTAVKTTLAPTASAQHIQLALEELPAPLPLVAADRTRLVQVLMNFGSNAIKYNRPSGRVSLFVSSFEPDRIRIGVRDNGLGVPADKQAQLFQPFQRAGQELGSIQGTGIGLVISERLARLMGGRVGFHSVEGQGSEFWIELPACADDVRAPEPPLRHAPHSLSAGAGTRWLMLYVEDNLQNVAFMSDFVSMLNNVELLTAPSAEAGLELAREHKPHVILMDLNLPGISGMDALQALRRDPQTQDIPVIALTAVASENEKQRGIAAGFCRYLTKPIQVDEFIATLETLLHSQAQPQPGAEA